MTLFGKLEYYFSCIYKNLMPDLFKYARYAIIDGERLCTTASQYETEFKLNGNGEIEYIGTYESSELEKKEFRLKVESDFVFFCVLFFDRKKYNSVKKISVNACNGEANVSQVLKLLFCESIIESSYKNIEQLIKNLTGENGKDFGEKISPDEISRAIGRDFVSFVAMRCVRDANMSGGVANALQFFEKTSQVSLEKYEKKELFGRVLLASPNNKNIDIAYEFKEKVSFNMLRLLRKVLELTNDSFYLLFDGFFYGIGKIKDDEITVDNDVYVIRFEGLGFWNLYRMSDSEKILNVKNGIPSIPSPKIDLEQVEQKYKDVFGEESKGKFKDLYASVFALINQNKGGILLISDAAKEQSERLETQAILVNPFSIDANSITKLSSIDGAIMVDECGICYAIGLIFDGMVPANGGDSSRGSRYNSSVRFTEYLKSQGKKVMTIVVSDDGMVDLL
jgi:hypothetical protein